MPPTTGKRRRKMECMKRLKDLEGERRAWATSAPPQSEAAFHVPMVHATENSVSCWNA